MSFKSQSASLSLLALVLGCCCFGNQAAQADDLRLRDGTVIKADTVWERGELVWYQQGQIIRSMPLSEVVRNTEIVKPVTILPPNTTKRPARRGKAVEANPAPTNPPIAPTSNGKPITRIVFKDGAQLDADAIWEMGDKVAYRLGNMQTFIDKEAVAQVLKEYVPTSEPTPTSSYELPFTTRHAGLDQLIVTNATRHEIDPLLIYLVMQQESGFNQRAVSRAGARGLMQLMPGTARMLGVRNIHDPVENIEAGTRHLKNLLQRYGGDVNLALAAYNAGEEAVARYGNRVPPYRETVNYVRRIGGAYYQYKK